MAKYACVALCRFVYCNLSFSRVVYGYIGLCMAMRGCVGLRWTVQACLGLCMSMKNLFVPFAHQTICLSEIICPSRRFGRPLL